MPTTGSVAQAPAPHEEHLPFRWRYEECNVTTTHREVGQGAKQNSPPFSRAEALKPYEDFSKYMLPWYEWEKTVRLTGRKVEVPFEVYDDISKSFCITMKPEVLQYFAAKNPDHPPGYPIKYQYVEVIPAN